MNAVLNKINELNKQIIKKQTIENRFAHTLENCLYAKEELLKDGFPEERFFYATNDEVEIGYLLGEPLLSFDDFIKSALELYKEKCFSEDEDEDAMLDFYFAE